MTTIEQEHIMLIAERINKLITDLPESMKPFKELLQSAPFAAHKYVDWEKIEHKIFHAERWKIQSTWVKAHATGDEFIAWRESMRSAPHVLEREDKTALASLVAVHWQQQWNLHENETGRMKLQRPRFYYN